MTATNILVTVNGEDMTSSFTSQELLVLTAEDITSKAWANAAKTFNPDTLAAFLTEEMGGTTLEVNAPPTEYLAGKIFKYTFGSIARRLALVSEVASTVTIEVTAPKLGKENKDGEVVTKSGKVGLLSRMTAAK